jgi:hypothetical protein
VRHETSKAEIQQSEVELADLEKPKEEISNQNIT